MGFFAVEPPLRLKAGHVRFMGYLLDPSKGGLNFLLCRKDETDIYGEWKVCRTRLSALLANPRKWHQGAEPFGFDSPKDAREIESADHAVHVYQVQFSDDIQAAFLQVVSDAISRGR